MKPALFGLLVLLVASPTDGQRSPPSRTQQLPTYVTQLGATHFPAGEASVFEGGEAIAVTPSGAVIIAGRTYGSIGEAHSGASDSPDAFVARFDDQGNLEWIRQFGASTAASIPALDGDPAGPGGDASGFDAARDVALTPDGSIYVTGSTTSSLGETNGGSDDVFLAKLDAQGSLLWLRQLGAETKASFAPPVQASKIDDVSGEDVATSIVIDPSGAVYVAGRTSGDLGEKNVTTSFLGDRDVFLARFSAEGRLEWLRQMGKKSSPKVGFDSEGQDRTAGIAFHPNGSIVLAASSVFSWDSSPGDAYGTLFTFDSHGRPLASRKLPGSNEDFSENFVVDLAVESSSGRIFLAGTTRGAMGEWGAGSYDVYVATFHSDLELEWIRQLGPVAGADLGLQNIEKNEELGAVAFDSEGNLILAGWTLGSLSEPNASTNASDVFTAKFDGAIGEFVGVVQIGKTTSALHGFGANGDDRVGGLALGPGNTIVLTGRTSGNLGEVNAGSSDVFVMRFAPDGTL